MRAGGGGCTFTINYEQPVRVKIVHEWRLVLKARETTKTADGHIQSDDEISQKDTAAAAADDFSSSSKSKKLPLAFLSLARAFLSRISSMGLPWSTFTDREPASHEYM